MIEWCWRIWRVSFLIDFLATRFTNSGTSEQPGWSRRISTRAWAGVGPRYVSNILDHGGIRPRWGRDLQNRSLTLPEREEIMVLNAGGLRISAIARELERAPSAVSRELSRYQEGGRYRAMAAQAGAWRSARRPKPARLQASLPLRERVQADLMKRFFPELISGRLQKDFPNQAGMNISPKRSTKPSFWAPVVFTHSPVPMGQIPGGLRCES